PVPWARIWPSSYMAAFGREGPINGALPQPEPDGLRNPRPERFDAEGSMRTFVFSSPSIRPDEPPLKIIRVAPRAGALDTAAQQRYSVNTQRFGLTVSASLMLGWATIVVILSARLVRNNLRLSALLRGARAIDPATLPIDWSLILKAAGVRRAVP